MFSLLKASNILPAGIQYPAILIQPHKFVWSGDSVKVGLLSIVEISVRFPNLFQHRYAESQGFFVALKGESSIYPRLPKIQVHRVSLQNRKKKKILNKLTKHIDFKRVGVSLT